MMQAPGALGDTLGGMGGLPALDAGVVGDAEVSGLGKAHVRGRQLLAPACNRQELRHR